MSILVGLFALLCVAALVIVVGAMASGVGIIAGVLSLFIAPVKPAVQTAAGPQVSRSRAEIMQDAIPGTYAWDLKIEEEQRRAAKKAARGRKRNAH